MLGFPDRNCLLRGSIGGGKKVREMPIEGSVALATSRYLFFFLSFFEVKSKLYISAWELTEATLIRQLFPYETIYPNGDGGLLYVTLISKQTGEERRGTVCDDGFNTQAARLFCRKMGYRNREPLWGTHWVQHHYFIYE